jgi:hypothetical protein
VLCVTCKRMFGVTAAVIALITVGVAPAASAANADDWAKSYCKAQEGYKTAVSDADDAATTAASDVGSGDPAAIEGIVTTLETGLTDSQKAARKTVKALKKAGAPDVKNGANVQKAAVTAYTKAQKALGEGLTVLASVNPADPSTISELVTAAGAFSDAASATNDFALDVLRDAVRADDDFGQAVAKHC